MKTTSTYNKRSVMRKAWEIKKGRFGWSYTFSQCLKMAWSEEKKKVARLNDALDRKNGTGKYSTTSERKINYTSLSGMANSLVDYYANNTYNGD